MLALETRHTRLLVRQSGSNRGRSTDPEFLVNCERITQEVDQLTARHAV